MPDLSLAVCACTYKRPEGLSALLAGLAAQTFNGSSVRLGVRPQLQVIIVDNEGSDEVRAICAGFSSGARQVAYIFEPRRGIPFARNACLDHLPADCDFFAFVDDDEVPKEDWLTQLLIAQAETDADAIAGRVVPIFANDTPDWIASGSFFGAPRRSYDLDLPKVDDFQVLDRAATNNVLVRAAAVRRFNLRFDTAFAFSGGSDTMFFRKFHEQGGRIVYSQRAVVFDHIPASRANVRYMFRERFRIANINTLIERNLGTAPPRPAVKLVLDGIRHIGFGFRRIFKTMLSKKRPIDRFAVGAFQMAHGLGIIAAAFGVRYQHYK